ncbi:diaminopimelate decarboxylase [Alphaproteobacteria bacterium]|nr:diaminopimelate decarboxylase [Alphaproteobacteria bacterium]MDB3973821.1 diaminopimelate decarboxylase [Alphaproteobacteria bacterium]
MTSKLLQEFSTPFYLYDEEIIQNKVLFLNSLDFKFDFKFHFAVKANPNLAILNLIKKYNFGAEVVSAGELFKSLKAGFDPISVIFDGPGKTEFDLKYAITQQIKSINVENLEEIAFINEYSLNKGLITNIGIRINPDIDAKTLDKITTGKSGGKFGVSVDQIDFESIAKFKGVKLTTLSEHIGSQITDHNQLISSYQKLISLADKINTSLKTIQTLDFGGGFGVIDHSDKKLNFRDWQNDLNQLLDGKSYNIIFEPGRYVVADSGELYTKVLYIKKSGNKKIIITDSSFSEYLRPALYDITPPIKVLNESQDLETYDIAGGICESTDYLAKDVQIPRVKQGDFIKLMNVGAYGSSMSSTYNSRPRPLEILKSKEEYRVIRSRDTLEDLCKNEIM